MPADRGQVKGFLDSLSSSLLRLATEHLLVSSMSCGGTLAILSSHTGIVKIHFLSFKRNFTAEKSSFKEAVIPIRGRK